MKIFIINHTTHNKGDNSVLYNLINGIKLSGIKADITISTSDGTGPFWLKDHDGLKFTFINWLGGRMYKSPNSTYVSNFFKVLNRVFNQKLFFPFLLKSLRFSLGFFKMVLSVLDKSFTRQLLSSDLVICTGGHHISTVLEKDSINSQTLAIIASGQLNPRLIMWAQSIGPLPNNQYFKNVLQQSLNNQKVLVRDEDSVKALINIGLKSYSILPDSVFLSYDSKEVKRDNIVTVAVYTAGLKSKDYLDKYKAAWVELIDLIINKYDYNIQFMPMQYKGFGGDERNFINEIISCSKRQDKLKLLDLDLSPKDSIDVFNSSALVIGHKTHSVIYSLSTETPVIALAYHPKTLFFMKSFSFENFCFNDIIGNEKNILSLIDLAIEKQTTVHFENKKSQHNRSLLVDEIKSWNLEIEN